LNKAITQPFPETKIIPVHLKENAQAFPDLPAVHQKIDNTWQSISWSEYHQAVQNVAKALIATGHGHGDAVAILSGNRFEWFAALVGAADIGVKPAGVYSTNAPVEVAYVVNHCDAKTIIVEDEAQLKKVTGQLPSMPLLERIVLIEGDSATDAKVISWRDFLAAGKAVSDGDLNAREHAVTLQDTGALIYTSGTTGNPKGVIISNESVSFTAHALGTNLGTSEKDVLLSYLPLAHIAEQLVSVHIAIRKRYQVYICPNALELADYIKEVRPTAFFGVPRVWERFHAVLSARLAEATGTKARILSFATNAGTAVSKVKHAGGQPGPIAQFKYNIAKKLVFNKLRAAMGLDRTHSFLTGAAPTPLPVAEFFSSLGMELLEVYGQTEGTACTAANTMNSLRRGTVGKALPGIELKIAEDGEIIFRGPSCMTGYLKADQDTAETLIDGWIHTGDLGQLDDEGFLTIVGRKKDIIINSSGKNIAPKAVEGLLTSLDYVGQAVCVGDGQRFLVALLTLDPDRCKAFAEEHGCSESDVAAHPAMREWLMKAIGDIVNSNLARVEHIRNFHVLAAPFSPESGETTVTFKIKRSVVLENHADQIDAMYEQGQLL